VDLGVPIHLGVVFMYSWYVFPYCWRQKRSSETMAMCVRIMKAAVISRKTQERHAMPVPASIRNMPRYMGFLENW